MGLVYEILTIGWFVTIQFSQTHTLCSKQNWLVTLFLGHLHKPILAKTLKILLQYYKKTKINCILWFKIRNLSSFLSIFTITPLSFSTYLLFIFSLRHMNNIMKFYKSRVSLNRCACDTRWNFVWTVMWLYIMCFKLVQVGLLNDYDVLCDQNPIIGVKFHSFFLITWPNMLFAMYGHVIPTSKHNNPNPNLYLFCY